MKLEMLHFSDDPLGTGLEAADLRGLGNVVALFGPNGAGKTRLLNVVQAYLETDRRHVSDSDSSRRIIDDINEKLEYIGDRRNVLLPHVVPNRHQDLNKEISELLTRETDLGRTKDMVMGCQSRHDSWYGNFIPAREHLIVRLEVVSESPHEYFDRREGAHGTAEVRTLRETVEETSRNIRSTIPYLEALARLDFDRGNPDIGERAEKYPELFRRACSLVELFMGREMGREYDKDEYRVRLTLDSERFDSEALSRGERTLLFYVQCILKEMQASGRTDDTLEGSVIILDEPELHLHPGALNALLSKLRKLVGDSGQIWIATHAMSVLAFLEHNECLMMQGGKVHAPSSNSYSNILEGLFGSEDSIAKLEGIMQAPALWASLKFAADCLLAASVIPHKDEDPQLSIFQGYFKRKIAGGEAICVLDFGAGKGRLATELEASGLFYPGQCTYLAIEPEEDLHAGIRGAAPNILPSEGLVSSLGELPEAYDRVVDACILSNVLHEIEPLKWRDVLNGLLGKLGEHGVILIGEDELIPYGELPHLVGYLILGRDELRVLFNLSETPHCHKHDDKKYRERLLCAEIRGASKPKVTMLSVYRALIALRNRLLGEIRERRKGILETHRTGGKTLGQSGRIYAMKSHMLTNALFAIEELEYEPEVRKAIDGN